MRSYPRRTARAMSRSFVRCAEVGEADARASPDAAGRSPERRERRATSAAESRGVCRMETRRAGDPTEPSSSDGIPTGPVFRRAS